MLHLVPIVASAALQVDRGPRAEARVSFSFSVDAPADTTFQLVTPEGERRWDPSWNPQYLTSRSLTAGTVFRTNEHGQRRIWLLDRVDSPRRSIRYIFVQPNSTLTTIDVVVRASSKRRSKVNVTYRRVALTPGSDAAVREFQSKMTGMASEWASAFARALEIAR